MNTLLGEPETSRFGSLLRHWRTTRRLSQLQLALDAGISARHLSFLETGRAQPSREMVQLLAGRLDVPLAERNALLVGAGYAPIYGERSLRAPELAHVRRALEFTLRQQEPYPALVLDGFHNIVMHGLGLLPSCRARGRSPRRRVAPVLACAIAHELGHLLQRSPQHTANGVMRKAWNRRDYIRAAAAGFNSPSRTPVSSASQTVTESIIAQPRFFVSRDRRSPEIDACR